jgi:DNA-binding CsgD family transcriptional regulator
MAQLTDSRIMSVREADTGAPWLVTGRRLSTDRLDEVLAVAATSAAVLGWDSPPGPEQLGDHRAAADLLSRAWREAAAVVSGAEPGRLEQLITLLGEIKAAEERVRDELLERQRSAARVVRDALSVLREVDTVTQLTRRAPLAATTMGFDRAVLSRIEQSVWLPETAYVAKDPEWAEQILWAGRDQPRTLDRSLLETQIVRRNRPLLVNVLPGRANLHRAMVDTSLTRSYVAAPIVGWGRVIGFVHADCYHQRRNPDAMDRDLLWMFCEGLGTLITRATALEELARMRAELRRLADGGYPAGADPVCLGAPGAGSAENGPLDALDEPGSVDPELALTRRELDVLRLMSGGRTNAQIARRLVIAEGTVKSHVKHILRKLGAANRAEAVSRWLRSGGAGGVARPGYSSSRDGATYGVSQASNGR